MLDLHIEKLVYGGEGLARHEGKVVLAPFVAPGERVTAAPVRETKTLVRARPVEWKERSASRVEPECPVFGRCGGCDYQHLAYEEQVEAKRRILIETLERVGKIRWEGPVDVLTGEPWGYRNRTQLRVIKSGRKVQAGFLARHSHQVVSAASCPINSPALNRAHRALIEMAHERRFPEFLREVELFTNERDIQLNVRRTGRPLARGFFDWCAEAIEGFSPRDWIDYPCGEDVFRVGARSFFQVNRFLNSRLAGRAAREAAGGPALDLYSGAGLFSLPLARRSERVIAVDSSRSSIRDLRFNAERAGLGIEAVNAPVEDWLPAFNEPIELVVADPPRAGIGPRVSAELLRLRPAKLTLVSCDPATLARDLGTLIAGGYGIEGVTLADMFPQTFHIESVVVLALRR